MAEFLEDIERKRNRDLPGDRDGQAQRIPADSSPRGGEAGGNLDDENSSEESLYTAMWDRLERRTPALVEQARQQRQAARRLLEGLLAAPPSLRPGVIREPRFRSLALLDFLVEESRVSQLVDPVQAAELARLAAQLAKAFGADEEEAVAALPRAYCLGANARRLAGRLQAAEALLSRAHPFLTDRQGCAFFCRTLAVLRWEQGRIEAAETLLGQAALLFAADGLDHEVGTCLMLLGLILAEEARDADTLFLLIRGWDRMDREGHPLLALRGGLSLAAGLAEANQPTRARGVLRESWRFFCHVSQPAEMARVFWLEGRVLALLGDHSEARHILESVRNQLMAEPSPAEAALESLDLALLLADCGRAHEIEALGDSLQSGFPGVAALDFAANRLRLLARLAECCEPLLRQVATATRGSLRKRFRTCGLHFRPLPFA